MIQSTSNLPGFYRTDALSNSPSQKTPVSKTTQAETGDKLSSASTDTLRQALAQTDEVRPNMVAHGKALAIDPSYPPRVIIDSLAKLMIASRDLSAKD